MKKVWPRIIQAVGVTTLGLSIWGCYFLAIALVRVLRYLPAYRPEVPFFRPVFFLMTVMNVVFLATAIVASIGLLKLKRRAVAVYTGLMIAIFLYVFCLGALWLLPAPYGISIGAASGIGDMGIGPLELYPIPFVYPFVSVVLINVAHYKLRTAERAGTPALVQH